MRILSRFLCQDSLLQVEVSSFFIFFRKCSIPQFSTLALQFVLFLQQCIPLSVFFPILSDRWSLGLHRFKIGNHFVKSSCDILERDSGEGINHPAVVVESWTGKNFLFQSQINYRFVSNTRKMEEANTKECQECKLPNFEEKVFQEQYYQMTLRTCLLISHSFPDFLPHLSQVTQDH